MDRILFVDDEERLLAGMRRNLRKEFDVHTALSGAEGLEQLQSNGPFSVIVSDMQMPGMNGVEFLVHAKAAAPDSIRIMLTGNADQHTAVAAINAGNVHQFLNKPCETSDMIVALHEAVDAFRKTRIEKDLLERTFQASVEVLVEIMSLANPAAFGRSARLADTALQIAETMGLEETWSVRSAALLSQMGCIHLPEQLVSAIATGEEVSADDWLTYANRASQGADLLGKIPRLEDVAEAIRYQSKNFDGSGIPDDSVAGNAIPLLARILRVVLEADTLMSRKNTHVQVLHVLQNNEQWFDPDVVKALAAVLAAQTQSEQVRVEVKQLTPNMVLAEDVVDSNGVLLVCRGWDASESVIKHLQRAADNGQIGGAVLVTLA